MAIDTEVKRRSVHGYAGGSATIAPVPDGAALDEGDRRQVAGIYRGIISGAGSTLIGTGDAYLGSELALYAGAIYEGVWRVDDLQMYQAIDETSFSVDVATSSGVGRALLIFIATAYMETDTPLSIACGYEACTEIIHEDADRLFVFPNPPAGGASVHFAFGFDVRPLVFVLSLSNVDAAGLLTADTDTAAAETVDVTADYVASDALLAMTHSVAIHNYVLSPAAGCVELAEAWPVVLGYEWTNVTMRPIAAAGTDTVTVGADHNYSGGGTPTYMTLAVRISQYISQLTGEAGSVIGGATLYAGEIQHEGQTLYGAAGSYITATTTLYSGTLEVGLVGAYIAATTTLYAGAFDLEPGPDLFINGFFIGLGQPAALNGAYIDATTALYAGALEMELFLTGEDASYIVSTAALYTGTALEIVTATGFIAAGQIIHV